jgi:hypothetical protein
MVDVVHDVSDTLYRAIPSVKVEMVSPRAYLEDILASGKLLMYILKLPPTKNWRPILINFGGQLDSVYHEIGAWSLQTRKLTLRAVKAEVGLQPQRHLFSCGCWSNERCLPEDCRMAKRNNNNHRAPISTGSINGQNPLWHFE